MKKSNMVIKVNGVDESVDFNMSVMNFLKEKSLDPARVVIEINHNIIKKNQYSEYILQDGDSVEILRFVGGG